MIAFAIIGALCLLVGCMRHSPGAWAEDFVALLECGMTPKTVNKLADGDLKSFSGRSVHGTHYIHRGGTDVLLDFRAAKLQSAQIEWVVRLTLVEAKPRVSLCGSDA